MSSCNVVFVRIVIPRVEGGGMSKSKSCLRASNRKLQHFFVASGLPRFICIVKM